MITRKLSLYEAAFAIFRVSAILDYKEPVGRLDERSLRKLDACIHQPFASFGGKHVYWRIEHKAAVMFYHVIKNHPLENGNKRTAVVLTMYFLFKNKRWVKIAPDDLYELAREVADSKPADKDIVIDMLRSTFRANINWI